MRALALYHGGARPLRACCCHLHRTGPAGPGSSTAEHLPCNQAIGVQFSSRARTLGARDLRQELKHFSFAINARGRDTYEAGTGSHDDLVIALGLALWSAERWLARGGRKPGARLHYYGPSRLPDAGTVVGTAVTTVGGPAEWWGGKRPGGGWGQ
jgi:hypothetical protein